MDIREWTHVLTLLSVAVIIDDRVYKEEVDMFVEQAVKLKEVISPEMIFSKKMAFDWFVVHRDEIKIWATDLDARNVILRHILALGESPHCKNILNAIYAIANVDGEYHPSEVDVIRLACEHWNLAVPSKP